MIHQLIEGFILLLAGAAISFVFRLIYDRRNKKGGKITLFDCERNQNLCFLKVTAKISGAVTSMTSKIMEFSQQLVCGDENFEEIKKFQKQQYHTTRLILMSLSELCGIADGCKESTKEALRLELLK